MSKILNFIKNLTTINSIILATKKVKITLTIILFDILLFVSIYSTQKLFSILGSQNYIPQSLANYFTFLAASLSYYFIQVLIFSFFSLLIYENLKTYFLNSETKLKNLKKFFLLNLIIAAILGIISIITGIIIYNSKPEAIFTTITLTTIPYIIFTLIFLNSSFSKFITTYSVKNSIKTGFKNLINKKSYFILIQLAVIIFIILIPISVGYNFTTGIIQEIFLNTYFILAYLVIFISRISFYNIVTKNT
tara:strand:+ start:2046 stop:2792 length:747 start_codon:yes stop_codon:yes gene_type:complete